MCVRYIRMLLAVQTILALCLFKTVAAAPQQGGTTSSSGPTPRGCGSFEAVSQISGGLPTLDSSSLIQLGGMAAVYNSTSYFHSSSHICGATLLSDKYLITAAHCVAGNKGSFSITVGREDINEKRRNVDNEYAIQNIYIHPSYDPAAHEYNDIAILMTDRKIKFTNKIYPFCLPDGDKVYDDYRLMQISGWGEVTLDNRASDLQSAYVNIIHNSRCESLWRRNTELYSEFGESSYPRGITNQIICAGRSGIDACRGDTGGPLTDTDKYGLKTVVGIIAKRTGCPDFPEPPGFYTNTATYINWIYETTGIPRPQTQPSTPSGINEQLCPLIDPSKCFDPFVAEQCPKKCAGVTEPVVPMTQADTQRPLVFFNEAGPVTAQQKVDIPTEEECGISLSNNVVGGELAARNSWPWLAAIGKMNGARFEPFCGGTLITKQHVISAAHCFKSNDRSQSRIIIRLGEHNTDEDGDGAVDFHILDRRNENHNTRTKENDIIILKLDRPINAFKDNIRAACLPFHLNDDKLEGKNLTVVGWGVFDNNRKHTLSTVPLLGHVPVVPVQECQQKYKKLRSIIINEKQICAGRGSTDSCRGDSGGPLNYLEIENGRFYLVGVVSFGPSFCGNERLPGVYARVAQYLDWIENSIRDMEVKRSI